MKTITQDNKFTELSNKYQLINSSDFIKKVESHGWALHNIVETKVRKLEKLGYQKHMMVFKNDQFKINDQNHLQLLVVNSHDGSTSFQVKLGIYRTICSNGLIVGNSYFDHRILHNNKYLSKLDQVIKLIPSTADKITNTVNKLSNLQLDKHKLNDELKQLFYPDRNVKNLLRISRYQDRADDGYTLLNVAQENLVRGYIYDLDKQRYIKKITSIKTLVDVNQKLFDYFDKIAA